MGDGDWLINDSRAVVQKDMIASAYDQLDDSGNESATQSDVVALTVAVSPRGAELAWRRCTSRSYFTTRAGRVAISSPRRTFWFVCFFFKFILFDGLVFNTPAAHV
jgi:hypothetical protein